MAIFPVYYFPPVSWFVAAAGESELWLEEHQHYHKQEYYNRMRIPGPNTVMVLSVPVQRRGERVPLRESLISYEQDWQKIHWRSIESAYRSSPWFEYYEDRLSFIFEQKWERLLDLNLAALALLRDILLPGVEWQFAASYEKASPHGADYRDAFDPTGVKLSAWYEPVTWTQVFGGFEKDPSALDLICNLGPEAAAHLLKCKKQ